MPKTTIAWTDRSVNPIRARLRAGEASGHYCEKVSQGCANCYASSLQPRFGMPRFEDARGAVDVFFDEHRLQEVLGRKVPTKWFWCDMTDMFGSWVPDAWIDRCFATMAVTGQHVHQVLTKRVDRMAEYINGLNGDYARLERAALGLGYAVRFMGIPLIRWPLPNVWLGTSVEDQSRLDERVGVLLSTPAAVRFLSAEPLLGPLDLSGFVPKPPGWKWAGGVECRHGYNACPICDSDPTVAVDWIIAGGESGPSARPCELAWIRSILAQCRGTGTSVFVKQLGANISTDVSRGLQLKDRKGADPSEWPEDLRVQEFPQQ